MSVCSQQADSHLINKADAKGTSDELCGDDNKMANLQDNWTLYIHYPNDTNWDIDSYKIIDKITNLQQAIVLFNMIPCDLYMKCMFFLMRKDIKPLWEEDANKNGGAFSYKIDGKDTASVWKYVCYQAIGETLINCINFSDITGVSLSPKKNFSIIKIWTSTCNYDSPEIVNYSGVFRNNGCIFKKHIE